MADYHTEIVGVIKLPVLGGSNISNSTQIANVCQFLRALPSNAMFLLGHRYFRLKILKDGKKKRTGNFIPSAVNKALLVSILLLIWGISLALIEALQLSAKGSFSTLGMTIISVEHLGFEGVEHNSNWQWEWTIGFS